MEESNQTLSPMVLECEVLVSSMCSFVKWFFLVKMRTFVHLPVVAIFIN